MKRREMLILLTVYLLPLLGIKACMGQDGLAGLLDTLGSAIAKLAAVAGNQELATRILDHTNSAVALIRNWKPGQNATDIIRALNRIIDDLNVFPDKFKQLVTLALGTIASIIERIKSQGGQGENPHTNVHITDPPKTSEEFKRNWDAIRASSVGMEQVPIL